MGTLVKILITLVMAFFMTSCHFDIELGEGHKGNGNVVTETRTLSSEFTEVSAAEGLDVYVTQDDNVSITIEADENIIEFIETELKGNELVIHTSEKIGRAKSKKIYVSLPRIEKLSSSSGADLYTQGVVKADKLELHSSSGADLRASVNAGEIICKSSSGSDIRVDGTATTVMADASSGSDIQAGDLETKNAYAEASSGADITVNPSDKLDAKASSGGDVRYKGNPDVVSNKGSFGGSVNKD